MQITDKTSESMTLEGWLPDQSALAGVLDTLFTLHLPLLEITCLLEQQKRFSKPSGFETAYGWRGEIVADHEERQYLQ